MNKRVIIVTLQASVLSLVGSTYTEILNRLLFAIPSDIAKYKTVVMFARSKIGVLDICK